MEADRPWLLIYMHGSDARQRQIADSLNELAGPELTRTNHTNPGARAKPSQARNGHDGPSGLLDHETRVPNVRA